MYCKNCGAKVDGRKKFCDACGSALKEIEAKDFLKYRKSSTHESDKSDPYQPTPPPTPLGDEWFGALIFAFIPGGGSFYFDKTKKGYWYVGIFIALMLVTMILVGFYVPIFFEVFLGLLLTFYIFTVIDTIWMMIKYSKFVKKNFRIPEKGEKW